MVGEEYQQEEAHIVNDSVANPLWLRIVKWLSIAIALIVCMFVLAQIFVATNLHTKIFTMLGIEGVVEESDYRIPYVPYWGGYVGSSISTAPGFAAMTVVNYWGDPRYTASNIADEFQYSLLQKEASTTATEMLSEFLGLAGYRVEIRPTTLEEIKSAIDANEPVLVFQRLALDAPETVETVRVAIGYSDSEQTLEFHDNNFGNNYKISYDDFAILNLESVNTMFVVNPSDALRADTGMQTITGEYPARLGIMDDPDIRSIQIDWVAIDNLLAGDPSRLQYQEVADRWKRIIEGPGFEKLHPAARYMAAFNYGRILTNFLRQQDEAVRVFADIAIPIAQGYDFRQSFGEWQRENPEVYDDAFWKSAAWVGLGVASIRNDDLETAEEAFRYVREVDSTNADAAAFFTADYSFADLE